MSADVESSVAADLLPRDTAQRLHPATLLLSVVRVGPQMANMLPAVIALGVLGRWQYIVPAILLFALISLIASWLAWSRFEWRVGEDAIAIKRGIFSRTDRTLPFDRIQDVSIEQGLIQRALGIATVGFETGAAAAEDKDDGRLNAISLAQAQALRAYVRDHRPSPVTGTAAVTGAVAATDDDSEDRLLFAMSPLRLVQAGSFGFSLAIVGVLFGLLQTFDNFLPINPFDFDFWVDLTRGTALESWVGAHRWLSAVGGLVMLLALGLVTGVVRSITRDWGFRLARSRRGLRRTRGLTTRTDVSIPLARVQAALVGTGWVRRRLGWYDLKLQSLANDGKNESDHVVAPFARLEEVDTILSQIALDRAGFEEGAPHEEAQWHRSLPALIFRVAAPLAMIAVLQFAVTSVAMPDYRWVTWVAALSAPFMLLLGWLDWRNRRWLFDGHRLHVTSGFLARRHIILPARNVQSADIAIGPVLRRFGGATLILGVPGGKGDVHRIVALPVADAHRLRDAVLAVR